MNRDQRITQDVDNFSSTLGTIVQNCITAPLIICYYTYLTWKKIDWFAPLIIATYFFLGYLINKIIMSPIVRLVFRQESTFLSQSGISRVFFMFKMAK